MLENDYNHSLESKENNYEFTVESEEEDEFIEVPEPPQMNNNINMNIMNIKPHIIKEIEVIKPLTEEEKIKIKNTMKKINIKPPKWAENLDNSDFLSKFIKKNTN